MYDEHMCVFENKPFTIEQLQSVTQTIHIQSDLNLTYDVCS